MPDLVHRIYSIVNRGDNLPVWVTFLAVAVLAALAARQALARRPPRP